MTDIELSPITNAIEQVSTNMHAFIDTHTHFDAPIFDSDREQQVRQAYDKGVRHLVLVGYLYQYFDRMYDTF